MDFEARMYKLRNGSETAVWAAEMIEQQAKEIDAKDAMIEQQAKEIDALKIRSVESFCRGHNAGREEIKDDIKRLFGVVDCKCESC